jgi:hypothetical protein
MRFAVIAASRHLSPWLAELTEFLLAATMLVTQLSAQAEMGSRPSPTERMRQ